MRDNGRWRLNDLQRLFVAVAVICAFFLAAMSWGMGSMALALIALVLLVLTGLGVFLLGLRYTGRQAVQGTAYVIAAPPRPVGAIIGRCDMRLLVDIPGGGSTMMKLRDSAVPVIKWPRVGSVLPVEVDRRNRRALRVRWELVDPSQVRVAPSGLVDELTDDEAAVPFFTDYADPVPPRFADPSPRSIRPIIVDGEVLTRPELSDVAAGDPDDDGPDLSARTRVPLEPPAPDPDWLSAAFADTEFDTEFDTDVEADAHAQAAGFEVPVRGIPQPRPAEPPTDDSGPQVAPPSSDPAATRSDEHGQHAMGIMLIVSDLARSLRFYQGLLDFEAVDTTSGGAVLAYGGGRILLRQVADMSPVDRRVVHLHVQVPDVEAAYRELRARGVEFVHRPRVMSRGDKLELWAATFRDPDGHAIALTQWRDRQGAPHQS